MKVCTYKRPSPFGIQKRLGLFLDEKTLIDVNLLWKTEFESLGFYAPEKRAQIFAPESLAQFLRVHQDAAIPMLQDTSTLITSSRRNKTFLFGWMIFRMQ